MSQDPADQIPVMMPMSRAARDVLFEHVRQSGDRPDVGIRLDDVSLVRSVLVRAAAMLIGEIERLDRQTGPQR